MNLSHCLDFGCNIQERNGRRVCVVPHCGIDHGPVKAPTPTPVEVAVEFIRSEIRQAEYEAKACASSHDEEFHLLADALHIIDKQILAFEHLFRTTIKDFPADAFKTACGMVGSVIDTHGDPEVGPRGERYWEIPNPLKHRGADCTECGS